MTARQRDWHLVGHDSDPVPASSHDVDALARQMRRRADSAGEIRDVLRAVSDLDGWRGEAAESFGDKAGEVVGDLGKVVERYDAVAGALESWSGDVETARTASANAVTKAEHARDTMTAHPMPDAPPLGEELTATETDAKSAHERASGDLDQAQADLRAALATLDDAAERAKNAIEDAADIWDDGWWGNVKGWVRDNADLVDAIVTVLQVVAAVVGVILLVVAVVATAPFWLVAAAVALTAAVLVGTVLLVVADTGKKDWGDVAWVVADLALTLVGGRAATQAARGLRTLVPQVAQRVGGQARSASLTALIGRSSQQFSAASRIADPSNNLARWVTRLRGTAAADGAAASQRVLDLADLAPTRVSSVLHQGRDLARNATILDRLRNTTPLVAAERALATPIDRQLRIALGANTYGTLRSAEGMPGTVHDVVEIVHNPPWTARNAS